MEETRRLLLFCWSEIFFNPKWGRVGGNRRKKNRNILLYGAWSGEENEEKDRNILLYRGGKKKFKKKFYYIRRRRRWRVTRRRSVRGACAGRWEAKQRLRVERRRLGRNARFWAGAHARAETKATGPGEGRELANGNGRNGGTKGGRPPPPRIFVQTHFRTGGGGRRGVYTPTAADGRGPPRRRQLRRRRQRRRRAHALRPAAAGTGSTGRLCPPLRSTGVDGGRLDGGGRGAAYGFYCDAWRYTGKGCSSVLEREKQALDADGTEAAGYARRNFR